MDSLLKMIAQDLQEIMNESFSEDPNVRNKLCDNLFEIEKCLKKIREYETNQNLVHSQTREE